MPNLSTYLADKILDHCFAGPAYPQPTPWVALFDTEPTMPGGTGGTEVSGGAYGRVQLTSSNMAAAASESKANSAVIVWAQATASWGVVGALGIYDASTAGNLLIAGPLSSSSTIGSGDTFSLPIGDLVAALS